MKSLCFAVLALSAAVAASAQTPAGEGPASPAPAVESGGLKRSQAELDKLLAPIALYPDQLVALILPASTVSADIVLAVRYLDRHGSGANFEQEEWEESVKALARYPTVLRWMDTNLAWTRQLGGVFLAQPADVMNTLQKLRADARKAGLLADTPQQRVVEQGTDLLIVPTSTEVIHVPVYNVETVYLRRRYYGSSPFLSFSVAFAAGHWLCYDIDWPRRSVWINSRAHGWHYRPDWRIRPYHHHHHHHHTRHSHRPAIFVGHAWRPDPVRVESHSRRYQTVRGASHDNTHQQIIANRPYRFHPAPAESAPPPETVVRDHGRHSTRPSSGRPSHRSAEDTDLRQPHYTGRPDLGSTPRSSRGGDERGTPRPSSRYSREPTADRSSPPPSSGSRATRYEGSSWSRPAADPGESRRTPPPPAAPPPPAPAASDNPPAEPPPAEVAPPPRIRFGR